MIDDDVLNQDEKNTCLALARESIERAVKGLAPLIIDLEKYSPGLTREGASFVTLTKNGALRGCIGTLEAYQPFVQDVCEHAVAAALEDYRFPPVSWQEIENLTIEISRLTQPIKVNYQSPDELLAHIRSGIDGVIIKDGIKRATFLPQVWEKLPDANLFFSHLCQKMGAPSDLWKKKVLEVLVYQVEEFSE